jgi:hypothetical protein
MSRCPHSCLHDKTKFSDDPEIALGQGMLICAMERLKLYESDEQEISKLFNFLMEVLSNPDAPKLDYEALHYWKLVFELARQSKSRDQIKDILREKVIVFHPTGGAISNAAMRAALNMLLKKLHKLLVDDAQTHDKSINYAKSVLASIMQEIAAEKNKTLQEMVSDFSLRK